MPNLLPEDEKKKLFSDYRRKIISLYLIFGFFLTILAGALLLPSYLLSRSKLKDERFELQILKESVSYRESRNIEQELKTTEVMIDALGQYTNNRGAEMDISAALNALSSGIRAEGISWRKIDERAVEVVVSGVSDTRDTLLAFSRNLENTKKFSKVDLPISNLAKDRDISFVITLTVDTP